MARLGQIILAYFAQKPEQAKIRTNDIFGEMYETIFDVQFLTSQRIIAVHTLNYMIEERRQLAKQRQHLADKSRYDEHWIIEGGFHVLYVIGLLCERDGLDRSDLRRAASRLNEAIEIVGEFVAKHPGVAAYRLFRTVGTAEALSRSVGGTSRKSKDQPQYDLFEITSTPGR
jgi:hypothetical protein